MATIDIDLDDNTSADIAFGGTNATTAAGARTNLGLGTAAVANVGTGASDVAAGNHAHTGVYEPAMTAASQAEMEAGSESALRSMSPLRVAQAIAALASATGGWPITALDAEPGSPVTNTIYLADCSNWDPCSVTGSTAYWVLYTGSTWVALLDADGNWLISSLPATVEVDGHTNGTTLTAVQMHSTVVYNTGQAASDVVLNLPTAAAGLSALFQVGTAQGANDWKVRAGASDKIYAIAADGTISAGSDNGYYGFAATAVGNSFAVWSFRSGASTWDWCAKAISGTVEAIAPA